MYFLNMTTSGLLTIHPLTLVPNYQVGTNVYLWNEKTNSTVKFLSSDQVITESMFSFLLSNPSQKVFIQDSSLTSYHDYLNEYLATWLEEPRVPRVLKTAVFAESLHGKLTKALELQSVQKLLECSIQCGESFATLGPHVHFDGREVHRTLRHDSSFVTHAANTAFYAYLIAEKQGHVEESISEICSGAILHDIGKIEQGTIESNSGALGESSQDWTQRREKAHPTEGFRRLCQEPGVTQTQLMICYQHHERPDGQGFPVGLVRDEIEVASRICSVANRFDGLTSQREERPGMTRLAALRVLSSEKNTALDQEATTCLEQRMSQTLTN